MGKGVSTFLLRQRAFLKLYLITLTEKNQMYGLRFQDIIKDNFKAFGYRPNHSEIYKSLHELMDDGILERYKQTKEGTRLQEVVFYRFNDYDKAKAYKKLLKVELDRCVGLLSKAIKDNYS